MSIHTTSIYYNGKKYKACPYCAMYNLKTPVISAKESGNGYSECIRGHSYDRRSGVWS
jgi:hypothetical protein